MTVDLRQLPAGINDERSRAIATIIDRIGSIDLTPLLTARLDSVVAGALIHLAAQYHVAGIEGYDLMPDDAATRDLIRQAVALHRKKGTPAAVKQALTRAGFPDASIDESVGRRYHDGRYRRNGEIRRNAVASGWALFRVQVPLADDVEVTAAMASLLIGLINEWKNARSVLDSFSLPLGVVDAVGNPVADTPIDLVLYEAAYADGTYYADGTITGLGERDLAESFA